MYKVEKYKHKLMLVNGGGEWLVSKVTDPYLDDLAQKKIYKREYLRLKYGGATSASFENNNNDDDDDDDDRIFQLELPNNFIKSLNNQIMEVANNGIKYPDSEWARLIHSKQTIVTGHGMRRGRFRAGLMGYGEWESHAVNAIAVTRDGLFVTGSNNCTAKVWTQEGKCLYTLTDNNSDYGGDISAIAVTPDGLLVTGLSYDTAKVWTQNGECLYTLRGHTDSINAVAVLQNGVIVTGSADATVKVWTQEGKCLYTYLDGSIGRTRAMAVLPNGLILIGTCSGKFQILTQEAECLRTVRGHSDWIRAVAVLPDGLIVTGSNDHTAKVWTQEGECLHTLTGHTGYISAVAVLPNGLIVTGSDDHTAKVWTQEGECLHTLTGFTSRINAIAVLPNGSIVIGLHDGTVKIEAVNDGINSIYSVWARSIHCKQTNAIKHGWHEEADDIWKSHTVSAIAVTLDGLIVTGSNDATAKVWTQDGKWLHTLTNDKYKYNECIDAIAVLPNGWIVTGLRNYTAKVWTQDGEFLHTLTGHSDWIRAVAVLPNGLIVTGSDDYTAKVWTQEGECLHTLTGHSECIRAVAVVLPDGLIVTGSDDHTAKVWTQEGECLHTLTGHTGYINAVAVLQNGLIVTGSYDHTAKVWTQDGMCLHTLRGHSTSINVVAVLQNELIVTGASDITVKVWTQDGMCLHTLTGFTSHINAMAVLPNGSIIIGLQDGMVNIFSFDNEFHNQQKNQIMEAANNGIKSTNSANVVEANSDRSISSDIFVEAANNGIKSTDSANVVEANSDSSISSDIIVKRVDDNPIIIVRERMLENKLDLSHNRIMDITALGNALNTNSTLTTLNLNFNQITDIKALGNALNTNSTLTELYLINNNITNIKALGNALNTNSTLTKLALDNNLITVTTALANAFNTNFTLTTLNLSFNQITDITALGKALNTNSTLTTLNLCVNQITDITALGNALSTNTALTKLDLSHNRIMDINALGKALGTNSTLTTLDLSRNKIKDITTLVNAFNTNSTLTTLKLHGNNITPEDSKILLNTWDQFGRRTTKKINTTVQSIIEQNKTEYSIKILHPLYIVSGFAPDTEESGEMVKHILNNTNFNVNTKNEWTPFPDYTALAFASRFGKLHQVQALLDYGAKIDDTAIDNCCRAIYREDGRDEKQSKILRLLGVIQNEEKDRILKTIKYKKWEKFMVFVKKYGNKLFHTYLDNYGYTPLHAIIMEIPDATDKEYELFKKIIKDLGVDINIEYKSEDGTPLYIAVSSGKINFVKLLLNHGARILSEYKEVCCKFGRKENKVEILELLDAELIEIVEKCEAQPLELSRAQKEAMDTATCKGDLEAIKKLITDVGPILAKELLTKPSDRSTRYPPLHNLCVFPEPNKDEESAKAIKYICSFNVVDINHSVSYWKNKGNTALLHACMHGKLHQVRALLECGAKVDTPRNEEHHTPMFSICRFDTPRDKKPEITQKIKGLLEEYLEKNRDIPPITSAQKDDHKPSVSFSEQAQKEMLKAAWSGKISKIESVLKKHGPELASTPLYDHTTALHILATFAPDNPKTAEAITKLCQYNEVNVDVYNRHKVSRTPLMEASNWGNVHQVKALIKCGASIDAKSPYCETPLSICCTGSYGRKENKEIILKLLQNPESSRTNEEYQSVKETSVKKVIDNDNHRVKQVLQCHRCGEPVGSYRCCNVIFPL